MPKPIQIRPEEAKDFDIVSSLIYEAFLSISEAPTEASLVEKLRQSLSYVPELCLVAIQYEEVQVHIFYTRLQAEVNSNSSKLLALAQVSVLPNQQNKGIGSALIKASISKARELGYDAIILVGHEDYYPRFGFELLSTSQLSLPFKVPEVNAMILRLSSKGEHGAKGKIIYDPCFFEN